MSLANLHDPMYSTTVLYDYQLLYYVHALIIDTWHDNQGLWDTILLKFFEKIPSKYKHLLPFTVKQTIFN